jgi:hypothetical protein
VSEEKNVMLGEALLLEFLDNQADWLVIYSFSVS